MSRMRDCIVIGPVLLCSGYGSVAYVLFLSNGKNTSLPSGVCC